MTEQVRVERSTDRTTVELSEPITVVLTDARRKHILSALASENGCRSFESLTDAVIAESGGETDGLEGQSKERVAASLHHCHLPKLARHNLVEHDGERGDTTLTAEGAECAAVLGLN